MLRELKTYRATRYLVALREGGSLPAVVDTEGGGMFVVKFRGAGQGARALLAELLVGGLAESAGLPMPELALIELDASFGRTEKDPEIQDVLQASVGLNVGLRYLEGALNYDVAAESLVSAKLAAQIVWLDAFVLNVDRSARNPNLMVHAGGPWLIDHGAAFYVHYSWEGVDEARMQRPFGPISSHLLLGKASSLLDVDEEMAEAMAASIDAVVDRLPDALLMDVSLGREPAFESAEANRDAYRKALRARLVEPRVFVASAEAARLEVLGEGRGRG